MAIFRKLHVTFWSDPFIGGLTPEQKFFYLYLLTNERTRQCGIYEILKKQMVFDTGLPLKSVEKHLDFFIKKNKIKYDEKTTEIALKNWLKFNDSTSPKVKSCVSKEYQTVKNTVLIEYVNSMDTHTQEEQEQEEEREEEQEQKPKGFIPPTADEVVSYFLEKGYKEEVARKAHEYYDTAGWKDGGGKPVKNWRQKMISVWMKDEHKAPVHGERGVDRSRHPNWPEQYPYNDTNIYYFDNGRIDKMSTHSEKKTA